MTRAEMKPVMPEVRAELTKAEPMILGEEVKARSWMEMRGGVKSVGENPLERRFLT